MKVGASPRKKQTANVTSSALERQNATAQTIPNLHSRVHQQNSTQSPSSIEITISISFPPFQFTVCYKSKAAN